MFVTKLPKFLPAKANLSTHSFKKHFLGYLPTNTSCSCYTQKGFDQLIFAINYYVGVGYLLGSSFANQLRSSMGNYSKKSGPWEFPSEHWWCCSGYPTWTEQTQHSGLDWTQLSGQCPKVRVCAWLEISSTVVGCQTGRWTSSWPKWEPPFSQHAAPRHQGFQMVSQWFSAGYMGMVFPQEKIEATTPWPAKPPKPSEPPADVPAALARNINHGSSRAAKCDGDVILFVKKFISDDELSQEPLLVMNETRASGFSLVPTTKIFAWYLATVKQFFGPLLQDLVKRCLN